MMKKILLLTAITVFAMPTVSVPGSYAFTTPEGLKITVKPVADDDDGDDEDNVEEKDGDHTYTISVENQTGVDITSVFVSPADKDDWEEDLMGDDDTLKDGETVSVVYHEDHEDHAVTKWDMKVEVEGEDFVFEDMVLDDDDEDHIILMEGEKFEDPDE